jgi:hypothetical protein
MFRIEAAAVCALFLGAFGSLSYGPVAAQDGAEEVESDGPAPIDTTQSISAGADTEIYERGSNRTSAVQAPGNPGHASGTYAGVVPGSGHVAPAAARAERAAKGGPTITWPGFQMRPDGSSRVFIQSTAPLEPKVLTADNGKIEIELPRARVAERTNRLPLDTRFFNTPVTKVSVSAARSGTVVQLELRTPVTPQISSEAGAAGYFFTYIELPKGEYLKDATAANSGSSEVMPTLQMQKPSSKVIGKVAAPAQPAAPTNQSKHSVQGEASVHGGLKLGR